MRITNLLFIATKALSNNKLRALLTMLGIIIGVASVITMLAIGQDQRRVSTRRLREWVLICLPYAPELMCAVVCDKMPRRADSRNAGLYSLATRDRSDPIRKSIRNLGWAVYIWCTTTRVDVWCRRTTLRFAS